MKLRMIERLALLQVLPHDGSILDMKATHALRMALAPSEQEAAEITAALDADGMLKDTNAVATKESEVEIGPRAIVIVQNLFKHLDERKAFPENCVPLLAKFDDGGGAE